MRTPPVGWPGVFFMFKRYANQKEIEVKYFYISRPTNIENFLIFILDED